MQQRHNIGRVLVWHGIFGTKGSFMDLPGKFVTLMRQACVVRLRGVWRVPRKVHLGRAKAIGAAQNRAHIMGATNVVRDQNNLHAITIRRPFAVQ